MGSPRLGAFVIATIRGPARLRPPANRPAPGTLFDSDSETGYRNRLGSGLVTIDPKLSKMEFQVAETRQSEVYPSAVREQLERVLAHSLFKRSARMGRFLRLAVEQTLAGKA